MGSPIYDKIKSDINSSMKGGFKFVTETLRLLVDSVQKKMMAKKMKIEDVTDEIVIDCINSAIKQREESIVEFEKGKRIDLIQREMTEIDIMKKYRPAQMSKEELTAIIKDMVVPHLLGKEMGTPIVMGVVMKSVMAELKGKADGKIISEIVKQMVG